MGGQSQVQSFKRLFDALWERGQSSTIGVSLLTAIVVILAAVFGTFLFADFGSNEEQLLANVQGDVTLQGITIDHEGGDTFEPENIEVLLQGDTETELNLANDFDTSDGAGQFAPGDEWDHSTGDTFYGGEFRLLVVHEPTNSVLLDQPHSLPITDMTLLVENWKGEMQDDRAEVIGNGSSYNFTVQVNAEDGQPPETVPLSVASNGPGTNVFELSTQDGGSVGTNQAGSGFNVTVTDEGDKFGMISTGSDEFTASWQPNATGVSTKVELEAQLDESQFSDGAVLDGRDTTTVQVLKDKVVFNLSFRENTPSPTASGGIRTGYNVTNRGVAPGDVDVTVTYTEIATGTQLESCTVSTGTIEPGTSAVSSPQSCQFFNVGGISGDVNVSMSISGEQVEDTVTLNPPDPEFLVGITDAPESVPRGAEIPVEANVTNVGNFVDNQTVTLNASKTGYSDSDTAPTGNLSPGQSAVINLSVTGPASVGNVSLNVSSDQDYDTTEVEVKNVLIPIQTREEWRLVGGSFTGNTSITGGKTTVTTGSGSTVGARTQANRPGVQTSDLGTQNSLDASGERVAIVTPQSTQSPDVDAALQNILSSQTSADTVDLIRPDASLPTTMADYNTFVVYRFDNQDNSATAKSRAETFAANLNYTQSVVYLSTWTGSTEENYANAVETIHNTRSNPGTYIEDPYAIAGNPMEITTAHPIWTGIGNESAGERFYTQTETSREYGEVAVFFGYDGTILGVDLKGDGPTVGVNDNPDNGSTEVLLTNAVPYHIITDGTTTSLTSEAKTLLSNAVRYAAAEDGTGGGSSPDFEVVSVAPESGVTEGDSLDVDVTVENTGSAEGTQDVRLSVSDGIGFTQVDSKDISLDPGKQKTETLIYDSQVGDAPGITVQAKTDNDSQTETASLAYDTGSGLTEITYNYNTTVYSVTHPEPELSPGSGKFTFRTGSEKVSEALVWEDFLAGENWIRFEYRYDLTLGDRVTPNVSVGGDTKWSRAENTGGGWKHALIDVSAAGDATSVGFGVDIPSTANSCSTPCTLYYDNVTFVNHSLPLQTASDWERMAGTLTGDSAMDFRTDGSNQTVNSTSGQFSGDGTGTVSIREDLSGGDWLSFDYKGTPGTLEILVNGTTEETVTSSTGSWESRSVFLDGYTGNTNISFTIDCSSCTLNLDNVRLAPPEAGIPLITEKDWTETRDSFEFETDSNRGTMGFEVNDTTSSNASASARFTADEFADGVARVSVTEDLSGENAFSFDYKGADLDIAQVTAAVTVDNDTVWTSDGDPGGWTTELIDVSGYSTTTEIAFEMRVSTETLNEEEIFFDNVTWDSLPRCDINTGNYNGGNGINSDFEVISGDRSECALSTKPKGNSKSRDLLSSANVAGGFGDSDWFDPPDDTDYPERGGGGISYDVKVDSADTTAEFYFGNDPDSANYTVRWTPVNETLTIAGNGNQSTVTGGTNGVGEYYDIRIDWGTDVDGTDGVIFVRAVNDTGDTVAYTYMNDIAYDGVGPDRGIGFAADDGGKVVWDNLEYGGPGFEKVLPVPGASYIVNGGPASSDGPTGITHNGGWIHDRLPVEEGETRTYSYYVADGTELDVYLRDGPATTVQPGANLENQIHDFTDRLDFAGIGSQGAIVSLTIDYTDESEVRMRAIATRTDGERKEVVQTWSGADAYDEIYVSTYEFDFPAYRSTSLRLIPERTDASAANGIPFDPDVNIPGSGALTAAGFGHSGAWVDQNDPLNPGVTVRIPYFAPNNAPDGSLDVQLRDRPASDQSRSRATGPHDEFITNLRSFLEVVPDFQTNLRIDYSVPGEVLIRATAYDPVNGPETAIVANTTLVRLPDSLPDDHPLYLSTYELGNPSDPRDSIRYSPF